MKKILLAIVALSLIFGTSIALASDNSQNGNLEKISSPSEIKNFENIVKRGKELFGMKKIMLERIFSLSDLPNFEKIKKIGSTLWGLRKQADQTFVRPEAVVCVKTALDKKDAALKTGVTTGSTNLLTLIDARNACQKAALDLTTVKEQRDANKLCVDSYKKTMQAGKETIKKAQQTIWEAYKTDLKTCGQLQKAAGGAEDIKLEDGGLGIEL